MLDTELSTSLHIGLSCTAVRKSAELLLGFYHYSAEPEDEAEVELLDLCHPRKIVAAFWQE